MKKRFLPLLLSAALLCGATALPVGAASGAPESSDNYAKQNYGRWATPTDSYLYANAAGGLTRVEHANGHVIVEDYDSDFTFLSGRTLELELPLWGGFFAGAEYNFLIEGQNNEAESDSVEVIRVIRYDKSWNRLGQCSLKGANTYHPFDAGSCRAVERDGVLYIRTCHEMYTTSDGLNHQASLTMTVRESDMELLDSFYKICNISSGYVSHSFNQLLAVDGAGGYLVSVDHGDANPRAAVLYREKLGGGSAANVNVMEYAGTHGDNTTGANIGGLAVTSRGYVLGHVYDGQGGGGVKRPYLSFISRDGLKVTNRALPYDSDKDACPPLVVSTGDAGGYVMWNEANTGVNTGVTWYHINPDGSRTPYTPATVHGDDTLSYVTYNADGTFGSVQTAADAPLSDCQPIVYNGKVTWYVTSNSAPVFYTLDAGGVTAHGGETAEPAATQEPAPTPTPTPAPTPVQPTGFTLNSTDITLTKAGDTFQLRAEFQPEGATGQMYFRADREDLISVDDAGLVTALKPGVAIISVYVPNVGSNAIVVRCSFSETPEPTPAPAAQPVREDIPDRGTAYASIQTVVLDGVPVEFQAYALKDPDTGYFTNYMKLRDVAWWMTGTDAQFDVLWDQDNRAVDVRTGLAYLHMNGKELSTPFTGDRAYTAFTGETLVNGQSIPFTAITLADDDGGGYTYYKLRDLGLALGFNVGWDNTRSVVFVQSDRPYDGVDIDR